MTARFSQPDASTSALPRLDLIDIEVIRRSIIAIADRVDANIERTAYSPLVYIYKDYAVGIVDGEGQLLGQCTGGMPVFVADVIGAAVREGIAIHGVDGFQHGDIFITNYAGTIGQHLNNVAMFAPVFVEGEARPVAFVVVMMHWLDIGGAAIGSTTPNATDIYMEGLQFRSIKLYSAGRAVGDIHRMIFDNTRLMREVSGDIGAQVAGCFMGRDEMERLIGRFGIERFREAVDTIWTQSENAARAAISAIPDGTYIASTELDDDGVQLGVSIPVAVKVIVSGDQMEIDLSGLPGQRQAPVNSGRSGGGQSIARLAFRYLVIPEHSADEGSFRPLSLKLPEGTIVSACATAPMGNYVWPLPTLVDLVVRALGSAMPERAAAGHYGTFSSVYFKGKREDTSEWFQCADSGFGGWGALNGEDGPGPFRTMCHGDTRTIPVEVQEATYPVRVESFELRQDSGGPGQWRGGSGLRKRYLVQAPCTLESSFDRTRCPAWGLNGGLDASPGNVIVEPTDGRVPYSALKGLTVLGKGDRVVVETGGGGGFGLPSDRDRAAVLDDVLKGYISVDAAHAIYGLPRDHLPAEYGVKDKRKQA